MKLLEVCTLYLREKKLEGAKESTLSSYSYSLEKFFRKYLIDDMNSLTDERLYKLRANLDDNLSNNTIIDKIILINNFFAFAHKNKYIKRKFTFPIPKKQKRKVEIFHEQEQGIMIDYLIKNMNFFHFGILLTLFTGIRIGELSALQKKDIEYGMVKITKTLQRIKNLNPKIPSKTVVVIDTPKTENAIRDIPLKSELLLLFNNLYGTLEDDVYILTGTKKYIEPRRIENLFKELLMLCDIKIKKFHSMRHTFATNWVKIGLDIKALSELLGHSSIKITYELYVHIDFEIKKQGIEKMNIPKIEYSLS